MADDTGSPTAVLGIYLLGTVIVVLAVLQVTVTSPSTSVLVVEAGVPVAVAAVVYYGGYYLRAGERTDERCRRVLLSAVALVAVGEVVVAVDFLSRTLASEPNPNVGFIAVLVLAAGSALGLPVGLYYDEAVTKRAELERELDRIRSLNDRLDDVNQRLLVLNRVVRHNLRTELTLLGGYYEEFRERAAGTEFDGRLDDCGECIRNLRQIERKTEYVDRLGTGEDGAVSGTRDVTDDVARIAASTRSRATDVTVETDLVGEARVPDHPLLPTVLTELVSNALHHNDRDDLRVSLRVATPSPDTVEVVVADTGSGIPDHELAALAEGEEAPLAHASGIGLWLVKWVVAEMDGTVSFSRTEPSGTRVVMRFPRRPAAGAEDAAATAA